MALAQVCKCGHTKTDHISNHRKGELTRYSCEWFDCNCKAFLLAKKMSMNQGFVNLPTFIDCNTPSQKPTPYELDDCDKDGKISDFIISMRTAIKPNPVIKFNNGEYP